VSETRLGIEVVARNSASAEIKKIESNIKELEVQVKSLQERIAVASKQDLTIRANVEGLEALRANLASIQGVLQENQVILQGYKDKLNALRGIGAESRLAEELNAQASALERVRRELTATADAQLRLQQIESETAGIIAARAAEQGIPALQFARQEGLIKQARDERGRFAPEESTTFGAAIAGAEVELARAESLNRIRQDSAEAIALENRALAEKAAGLVEEARLSQEAANLKSSVNQRLANEAASTYAMEARFRAERQAGLEEAGRLGAEADIAKAEVMVKVRQDSAAAIALENRALAEKAGGLAEEAKLAEEAATLKAEVNQRLINDAATLHAAEAKFRAERVAGLNEEARLAQEAAELKANVNERLINDAAAVHAAEARVQSERRVGLEEESRLGTEAAALKAQFYRRAADDAARATAAETAERSKAALALAGYQQMPFLQRAGLFRSDDATRAAAGLDYYTNASAKVRAEIENTAGALGRSTSAISAHSRSAREATGSTQGLGFAFRELAVLSGEFVRGQRGQEISTFMTAIRRLGAGGAPIFIAPFIIGFGALRLAALSKEYSELATKTDDAARAAGIGVEEYSRLARVLQLAGISAERLPTAMGQLSQSMRTAIAEPLGTKATAWATILGKDFFTTLPKFAEEPLQTENIDLLRKKYQELARTVGEFQAMGVFRAALGRTEWTELAPLITATEAEYKKFNKAVAESHLPFTSKEIETLREVDFATKKLTEDWEFLGKAIAVAAGNTGIITWLDNIILKLGALARNTKEAGIGLASIAAGGTIGAIAGIPGGPAGIIAGAAIGVAAGGAAGAKIAESTRPPTGPRPGPEPGSLIVPVPPRVPGVPITTPSEAATREGVLARANIPTMPSPEEGVRYPQLYGFGGAKIAPESLITEAVKYREEIEQTHRVIQARLEAERAEALSRARSETDRLHIEQDFSQRELKNRAEARKEEEAMMDLYKKRVQDVPEAQRPLAEKELQRRVGVQIQVEELNTRKQLAQEEERFRREGFRVYEEGKRLELQLARGNWAQEAQIYQERLTAAKAAFGEESLEYRRIQVEMVEAAHQATEKLIQDRLRIQDTLSRIGNTEVRIAQARAQAEEIGSTVGRVDKTVGYKAEQALIEQNATAQISAYQAIAAAAGDNAELKIQALDKAMSAAESAANQEMQLAEKVAQEIKRQNEEAARSFVQLFDKAGSSFDTLAESIIFRTKPMQQALHDFFLDIDKQILHTTLSLGSQFAAQGLAKAAGLQLEPGKGLGDLLGNMVSKALGLAPKTEDKQALVASLLQTAEQQRNTTNQILGQIREAATALSKGVGTIQAGAGVRETAKTLPSVGDFPGVGGTAVPSTADLTTVGTQGHTAQVTKEVADQAQALLNDLTARGVKIHSLGGFRPGATVEGTGRPSQHAFGRAIDINADVNPVGSGRGTMPADMEAIAASHGARWGGTFQKTDPMHVDWPGQAGTIAVATTKLGGAAVKTSGDITELGNAAAKAAGEFTKAHNVPASEEARNAGLPAPYNRGGTVPGLDYGGAVVSGFAYGGAMGTDTIHAMLTPGEFVTQTSAVQHYGTDLFHALNQRQIPKGRMLGFAMGGEVDQYCGGGPAGRWLGGEITGFQEGGEARDGSSSGGIFGWLGRLFGNRKPDYEKQFWNLWPLPGQQKHTGMTLGAGSSTTGGSTVSSSAAPIPQEFLSQISNLSTSGISSSRSFTGSSITSNAVRYQEGGIASWFAGSTPEHMGPWASWTEAGHEREEYPWFSGGQSGPPDLAKYGAATLGLQAPRSSVGLLESLFGHTQGERYRAVPWSPPDPASGAGLGGALKLALSRFQEGGIAELARPSRERYSAPRTETPEEASEAIRKELSGENRTWQEIMTSLPSRGFAMRQEDEAEGTTYTASESIRSVRSNRPERSYWRSYAEGLLSQGLSHTEILKETQRVAPIGYTGAYTQSVREAFLKPAEQSELSAGESAYGMFPGSGRDIVQQSQGFARGGSVVAYFALGGINTPPPLPNAPRPYTGSGSRITTATTSGGITTESRGFLSPQLYTAFPKPSFGGVLAILGIAALGVAGAVGLERLLSDREKREAERLLAAKETSPAGQPTSETPLSADYLSKLDSSQISGLSSSVSGIGRHSGGAVGMQEGGIVGGLTEPGSRSEFQLAGDVIPFPGRAPRLPDPMNALKLQLEAAQMQGEWDRARIIENQIIGLEQFRLPKFHVGGKASDEILAKLQVGEHVLSRDQVNSVQKYHSGGYVRPGFAEGGVADEGMVGGGASYAPARSSASSGAGKELYSSVSSLSSSMSVLSSDVEKVAGGFKSLERAASPAAQTTTRLSGELSAVGSALGTFKGVLSSFSSMGSGGSGGGVGGAAGAIGGVFSLLGTVGSLFALQKGGLMTVSGSGGADSQLVQFMATPGERVGVFTPEQYRSAMVGGLPHFATGGALTVGSPGVAPAISELVQGAAAQSTGGPGTGNTGVNVHIGSINGVMNAHDVRRMLVNEFSSIARGFQRASRNNSDLPGR
jgi:hypothetical protein